ncbi:MAG: TatD family hydrolase, partial [Candidatus Aureabacteria bacterium]|nr:TatD family hydrolase [Candidatus Auribacterota bacterium]
MSNKYFDSHAHLASFGSREDILRVLNSSFEYGVSKILNICSDDEELERTLEIGIHNIDSRVKIYNSFGLHPHNAMQISKFPVKSLDRIFEDKSFICVGEVGLDYHRCHVPAEKQIEVFSFFLEYALSRDIAVSVHCRDAYSDVIGIIGQRGSAGACIIIHCFSGTKDEAMRLQDMGCMISFCGNITYPGSGKIREAASALDSSAILVETDSPYLAPQNKRGEK